VRRTLEQPINHTTTAGQPGTTIPLPSCIQPSRFATESTTAAAKALKRNRVRFHDELQANRQLLGTYISPISVELCVPPRINLAPTARSSNPWLLRQIRAIRKSIPPTFRSPPFRFELTRAAAEHNTGVLASADFDLHSIITAGHTICTPGAESRPHTTLQPLLEKHPLWAHAKDVLDSWAKLRFTHSPDNTQRLLENDALIAFNNHKKANDMPDIVETSIKSDVQYGFAFPIIVPAVHKIPKAMLCPLGIVQQTTLSAEGKRTIKNRLTHDQTFCVIEDSELVNNLLDMIYGHCLRRILNQIVALRTSYPTDRILVAKYDIKQAFRRVHYHGADAVKCLSIFNDLAIVQLRMTFGGSNCPTTWCALSEIAADLANEILDATDWDDDELQWNFQNLVPNASLPPTTEPLEPAQPTLLLPEPRPWGAVDVYIDDLINVILDRPVYTTRGAKSVPLAIDTLARPYDSADSPTREHMIALSKLSAEGGFRPKQTVLGWDVDTDSLLISLPTDKYNAWRHDIQKLLHDGYTTHDDLESIVGCLNNTGTVIPMGRFFLGDLRRHINRKSSKWKRIYFNEVEKDILRLWLSLLKNANLGVNLNLLTYRVPTTITITDACPTGMGGVSIPSGRAWRHNFHQKLPISNNSLEFLASGIGVLTAITEDTVPYLGSILDITDNQSCVCWLQRCSFDNATNCFERPKNWQSPSSIPTNSFTPNMSQANTTSWQTHSLVVSISRIPNSHITSPPPLSVIRYRIAFESATSRQTLPRGSP
jgi:hypothetical protein